LDSKHAFDEAIPNGEITDGRNEDALLASDTEIFVGVSPEAGIFPEVLEETISLKDWPSATGAKIAISTGRAN
jgi:hypothetical protein